MGRPRRAGAGVAPAMLGALGTAHGRVSHDRSGARPSLKQSIAL